MDHLNLHIRVFQKNIFFELQGAQFFSNALWPQKSSWKISGDSAQFWSPTEAIICFGPRSVSEHYMKKVKIGVETCK